jgi:hypothetical protein
MTSAWPAQPPLFIGLAEQTLKLASRQGLRFHLIFIDGDNLKYSNDNFGHPEGDFALQQRAALLKNAFARRTLHGPKRAKRFRRERFSQMRKLVWSREREPVSKLDWQRSQLYGQPPGEAVGRDAGGDFAAWGYQEMGRRRPSVPTKVYG